MHKKNNVTLEHLPFSPRTVYPAVHHWLLIWPVQWHNCCSQFLSTNEIHSLPEHDACDIIM